MSNYETDLESALFMESDDDLMEESDFEGDLESEALFEDEGDFESFEAMDLESDEDDIESLALELVELSRREGEAGDAEVDHFLGALASIGSGLIGSALKSKTFRKIGGSLVKKAMPLIGKVTRHIPGLSKLNLAKGVVRTLKQAGSMIARNPRFATNPAGVVRASMSGAIRKNLPRSVRRALARTTRGFGGRGGRWIRRGSRIILLNA